MGRRRKVQGFGECRVQGFGIHGLGGYKAYILGFGGTGFEGARFEVTGLEVQVTSGFVANIRGDLAIGQKTF